MAQIRWGKVDQSDRLGQEMNPPATATCSVQRYLFSIYVGVGAYVCVNVTVLEGKKMALDVLELELQVFVSCQIRCWE